MKKLFLLIAFILIALSLSAQRVEIEIEQDTSGYTKVTTTYAPNGTDKNVTYEFLGPDSTSLQGVVSQLISQSNNTYTTAISLERQSLDKFAEGEGIDETADAILSAINAGSIKTRKNESLYGNFAGGVWQFYDIEEDTISAGYVMLIDGSNQAYMANVTDSTLVVNVDLQNPVGFKANYPGGPGEYGILTFSYAFEIPVGDQPFRRFQYTTGNRRKAFIRTIPTDSQP